MPRIQPPAVKPKRKAWNKGRLIGQKRPLLPKQVWAIRARLELAGNFRDLALFNLAIDSNLRTSINAFPTDICGQEPGAPLHSMV
jgi:hypothetical protein